MNNTQSLKESSNEARSNGITKRAAESTRARARIVVGQITEIDFKAAGKSRSALRSSALQDSAIELRVGWQFLDTRG